MKDIWFRGNSENDRQSTHVRAVFCGMWQIGAIPAPGHQSEGPSPLFHAIGNLTQHELSLHSKLSRPSPNQAAMDTVLENESNPGRTTDIERSNVQTHLCFSSNVIQLYPGDQCILFRATEINDLLSAQNVDYIEPETTQHCLLIGSPVNQTKSKPAERLVWLNIEKSTDGRATVRYIGTCNVSHMSCWVTGSRGTPHKGYEFGKPKNIGFLSDGSRYLVYRFALYMDGFNQGTSADSKKVGGFYLMPLGFSLEARRNRGAPHVLTLASCTMSYNRECHC